MGQVGALPHEAYGLPPASPSGDLAVVTLQDAELEQLATALEQRAIPVLRLDPRRDGLDTLLQQLEGLEQPYERIRLFSHGDNDRFRIGRQTITGNTLNHYGAALGELGRHLTADGDLLIYGCNLAASGSGQRPAAD